MYSTQIRRELSHYVWHCVLILCKKYHIMHFYPTECMTEMFKVSTLSLKTIRRLVTPSDEVNYYSGSCG